MKQIVGNLVVTDLQKYLDKPLLSNTLSNQSIADAVNEFSKRIPYDFNRVRKSVIDAYEGTMSLIILSSILSFAAALSSDDKRQSKKKSIRFERDAARSIIPTDNPLTVSIEVNPIESSFILHLHLPGNCSTYR